MGFSFSFFGADGVSCSFLSYEPPEWIDLSIWDAMVFVDDECATINVSRLKTR